ncbi:MAG: glycosyltransferase, partial [Actinomycetota bacterium]
MTIDLSYVLPLRIAGDEDIDELTTYLEWLAAEVEVIVVDGSEPGDFASHATRWGSFLTHLPPEGPGTKNGKVGGVITGVRSATHEKVIVADDDVRYDRQSLARMKAALDDFDLIRPQNYFDPLPWHALWDTGRTLLNRAWGADYPGTLGVRRSTFLRAGGYDGDALFENLELIRTMEVVGASAFAPLDLYVSRRPPRVSRFLAQRPRQAYDDLAQPVRLLSFLSVVPLGLALRARKRASALLVAFVAVIGVAEVGRRRQGGTHVFPAGASLLAPLWVAE